MVLITNRLPRPPYDPEIARALFPTTNTSIPSSSSDPSSPSPSLSSPPPTTSTTSTTTNPTSETDDPFDIPSIRAAALRRIQPETDRLLQNPHLSIQDYTIPGRAPGLSLIVTVVRRKQQPRQKQPKQPGILYIHGGALVRCNRFAGLDTAAIWALGPDPNNPGNPNPNPYNNNNNPPPSSSSSFSAVTISVEYSLAPEHPGTAPAEDCYAALQWIGSNLEALNIDPAKLMIYGVSAGGCLAAATALMLRDAHHQQRQQQQQQQQQQLPQRREEEEEEEAQGAQQGKGLSPLLLPEICGLGLECPMLDDRTEKTSVSCRQFATLEKSTYNATLNRFAWSCLLGDRVASPITTTTTTTTMSPPLPNPYYSSSSSSTIIPSSGGGSGQEWQQKQAGVGVGVSPYEAPARATSLQGLPPLYLDCASADPLRDDIVAFASRCWADGVEAELHVMPGGPHGFDRIAPEAQIAKTARRNRLEWMGKIFSSSSSSSSTRGRQRKGEGEEGEGEEEGREEERGGKGEEKEKAKAKAADRSSADSGPERERERERGVSFGSGGGMAMAMARI